MAHRRSLETPQSLSLAVAAALMLVGKLLKAWSWAWRLSRPRFNMLGNGISPPTDDFSIRGLAFWQESWKSRLIAKVLSERAGAFIDVGANIGQTLMDYLNSPVRNGYIGFEPNPLCAAQLQEIIRSNSLSDCRIVPAGLSDRTGALELLVAGGDADPGATFEAELRPRIEGRSVAVAAFRFDDLDLVPGPVALMKIDVEGHELAVLKGMARTIEEKRPLILCEVLHRDRSADPIAYRVRITELAATIRDLGYSIHLVLQDTLELEPVDEFPDRIYGPGSRTNCDYLLVPQEADAFMTEKVKTGCSVVVPPVVA